MTTIIAFVCIYLNAEHFRIATKALFACSALFVVSVCLSCCWSLQSLLILYRRAVPRLSLSFSHFLSFSFTLFTFLFTLDVTSLLYIRIMLEYSTIHYTENTTEAHNYKDFSFLLCLHSHVFELTSDNKLPKMEFFPMELWLSLPCTLYRVSTFAV